MELNNDGSGQIASGNIAWDTAGNVTFGASVSLQWKNDIEAAKVTNFGYRYYKKLIINGDEATYYPVVSKVATRTSNVPFSSVGDMPSRLRSRGTHPRTKEV